MRPIKTYLKPYGTLSGLRGSGLRSTIERICAPFDTYDEKAVAAAFAILEYNPDDPKCVYCGREALEWDHLEKAATGGGHQIGNLVPSCKRCNGRKVDWKQHLARVNPPDHAEREARIKDYIGLQGVGHSLFNKGQLQKIQEATERLLAAAREIDDIVEPAIAKFRASQKAARPR